MVVLSGFVFGHWVAAVATAVLIVIWRLLPQEEGPPVLALALTAQWVQTSVGVYYVGLTGRSLEATRDSEWVPMVLIGLASVLTLAVGLRLGIRFLAARVSYPEGAPNEVMSFKALMIVYFASVGVTGTIQQAAFSYPVLTQAILALSFTRLGIMSLVFRRLTQPDLRYVALFGLLAFEVGLGFTGFFSDFKEPLLLAGLALLEAFDRRKREHWIAAVSLAGILAFTLTLWMNVRGEYRADFDDQAFASSRSARVERIQALSTDWLNRSSASSMAEGLSFTIDRIWAVYYPALAVQRVPRVIPHTDGALLGAVLTHLVMPRVLFPDKPPLPNESEFVRRYAGVYVAGAEQGTTIAFGYVAESYVDFGIPLMFVPMLVFAFGMGCAYVAVTRKIVHRELAVALATCIFWLNLNQFERAWAKTAGMAITTLVYLGLSAYILDHWLLSGWNGDRQDGDEDDPGVDQFDDERRDEDEAARDHSDPPPAPLFGRASP